MATSRSRRRFDGVHAPQAPQPGDEIGFLFPVPPLAVPHDDVFGEQHLEAPCVLQKLSQEGNQTPAPGPVSKTLMVGQLSR